MIRGSTFSELRSASPLLKWLDMLNRAQSNQLKSALQLLAPVTLDKMIEISQCTFTLSEWFILRVEYPGRNPLSVIKTCLGRMGGKLLRWTNCYELAYTKLLTQYPKSDGCWHCHRNLYPYEKPAGGPWLLLYSGKASNCSINNHISISPNIFLLWVTKNYLSYT